MNRLAKMKRRPRPQSYYRGERSPKAKLSAKKVEAIRCLYESGRFSFVALGELFDVSGATINQVVRLDTWKDVE